MSIVSLVLSAITMSISVYLFFQRRFSIKVNRQHTYLATISHKTLHVLITVTNKSSLPISIIDSKLNNIYLHRKKNLVYTNSRDNQIIDKIYTSTFPINIEPYESVDIRLQFNSETEFNFVNYQLTLYTPRGTYHVTLLKQFMSDNYTNIEL